MNHRTGILLRLLKNYLFTCSNCGLTYIWNGNQNRVKDTGNNKSADTLLIVVDATNLDNHLRFALQLIALGTPCVVALNMVDLAARDGLTIDAKVLERELGVPVIETVAVRRRGMDALRAIKRA